MIKSNRMATAGQHARALGLLAATLLISASALAQSGGNRPIYKDANAPVEQRVQDLMSRMTLEEKIAQITAVWTNKNYLLDSKGKFNPAAAKRLYPAGIGHFTRPSDKQQA